MPPPPRAEKDVTRDAGRDLDALVAERVMAQNPHWLGLEEDEVLSIGESGKPVPHYSTDIRAAWKVVEKLGADMGLYYHGGIPEYEATFFGSRDGVAYVVTDRGETAPLAICRAALAAVAPRHSGNPHD